MLDGPIGITNTHAVGVVRDAIVAFGVERGYVQSFMLPVVAETYDGWLNDIDAFHVTRDHAFRALSAAREGAVAEGNVGGGTGMRCHEFKGGIGTSSRRIELPDRQYVVGALVQANYGRMADLRVDGAPVGRELAAIRESADPGDSGSIIVILATDAPLLPGQCRRLAQRATVGLARAGQVPLNPVMVSAAVRAFRIASSTLSAAPWKNGSICSLGSIRRSTLFTGRTGRWLPVAKARKMSPLELNPNPPALASPTVAR